jgi:hypothetical protein
MDLRGIATSGDATLVSFNVEALKVLFGFDGCAASEHCCAKYLVLRRGSLHAMEEPTHGILLA